MSNNTFLSSIDVRLIRTSVSHYCKARLSTQELNTMQEKQKQRIQRSNSPTEVTEQGKNLKSKERKDLAVTYITYYAKRLK